MDRPILPSLTALAALLLSVLWPQAAAAQTAAPLFAAHSEIDLLIEGPFDTIVRRAANNTDPHPATLTLRTGAARAFPIQLSARGLSRRRTDVCAFPPLRIEFARRQNAGTLFAGQGRLKLVTHCQTRSGSEDRVLLEYLAYRLYNLVTPMSFNVRPARVTYRDGEGRRAETTRFAFLIEDVDDMARRNGRAELEIPRAQAAQLDQAPSARAALFQYMIGNLDWSFTQGPAGQQCCHNARLISRAGTTAAIAPVPYDFDFSGLVDAPYAAPPEGIDVESVRTRVYRGLCAYNGALPAAAQEFRARQAAMTALIESETRLSQNARTRASRYVADFFVTLNDPQRFDRQIVRRCRASG